MRQTRWVEHFGSPGAPRAPWAYVLLNGCTLGKRDPDVRGCGLPVKKGQFFMANFDLRPAGLRCRDGVVSPKTANTS